MQAMNKHGRRIEQKVVKEPYLNHKEIEKNNKDGWYIVSLTELGGYIITVYERMVGY